MTLIIQLYSLGFSFVFGVIFSILIYVNKKVLFFSKMIFKVVNNFIFLMGNSILYFLCIKLINNGILHIYFFLMFLLGWGIGFLVLDRFLKK